MNIRFHYTINGDNKTGWSLNVYKFVPDPFDKRHDTITTYWLKPKEFDTFDELLIELNNMLLIEKQSLLGLAPTG